FADHRIAGDAAELRRDLARRKAVRPKLFQKLDSLVSPRHAHPLLEPVDKARKSPCVGQRVAAQHALNHQRFRRLSAARDVVLDDQKATIWPESGARLALRASTYSCTRVDELGTNRVRVARLSCVDSGATGNRMLFRAARRGGTFRLSRAAFDRAALRARLS